MRSRRGTGPHQQRALGHARQAAGRHLDLLQRRHQRPAGGGDLRAGVGEVNPTAAALQQPHPQGALEVPDLLGDRSLGERKLLGRPRDALGLGNGHEGPGLLERESRLVHAGILV